MFALAFPNERIKNRLSLGKGISMKLMVRKRSCCLLLVETGKGDSIMGYGGESSPTAAPSAVGRSRPGIKVSRFGILNTFQLAWFMKIYFSLLGSFMVHVFFATAPLTFAQQPYITIDYPTREETFTTTTIPGVSGTAFLGNSSISEVWVDIGNDEYVATGTTNWFVEGPLQLPVSPGVAAGVDITAYGTFHSGEVSATVFVLYVPPIPIVSINTPTNGQTFTTSPVTVSGTAVIEDYTTGMNLVQVQTNGTNGTWQTAYLSDSNAMWTSWSASVALSPGTNTIYVRGEDRAGLYSTNVWVNVTYQAPITPPILGIVKQNSNLVFTWPTNGLGFVLQCSSNLGPATVWSTNMPAPVLLGGQNVVTNPLSGSRMFFRLFLDTNPPLIPAGQLHHGGRGGHQFAGSGVLLW